MAGKKRLRRTRVTSRLFFSQLKWIDGRPLLSTMEPYRLRLFTDALDTLRSDGMPQYNFVLSGRSKKNFKTTDLDLAALYCLIIRGGDAMILANDEGQAADDLDLAKKLVAVNPDLSAELEVLHKEIRRKDGFGTLKILPARDVIGSHGKTGCFLGFDEIHAYKNHDLFEALALDPSRADAVMWVTSYDSIYSSPGFPLHDFKQIAKAGADPRMLCSWYSGDWCTDPQFAALEPELRANPSIGAWPEGRAYLEQQRRRLPSHKYRRLHLNLPGAPNNAFFDQAKVMAAIVTGRTALSYEPGRKFYSFVDMSGGSKDDAVLGVGHDDNGRAVLDLIIKQAGEPPFNPHQAVAKFAAALHEWHISAVMGDNFAGNTFRSGFEALGITYKQCPWSKSELYEALEPPLNAGEVELLDEPKLQEQLLTLVMRGAKVDHEPNGADDWANAAAGVVWRIRNAKRFAAPKPVMPGFFSKTAGGWITDPMGAPRSTTQHYYDWINNGAGASWPGSPGTRDW
jgi:hypothetical protein